MDAERSRKDDDVTHQQRQRLLIQMTGSQQNRELKPVLRLQSQKRYDHGSNKRGGEDGFVDSLFGAALPSFGSVAKTCLGVTVALYVLNQKHLLPKPLSRIVSKALFWPTMPITVARRIGSWTTVVDDTVIMGGAPFGFAGIPDKLYNQFGVRGVVNLCEEYKGPTRHYEKLGISHLRLPTVDHFESNVDDLERAVNFIRKHQDNGSKVYVHCRAGHGRSAAVVFAWLMSKDPQADLLALNQWLCLLRNVRKTLWRQKNILNFHARLLKEQGECPVEEGEQ